MGEPKSTVWPLDAHTRGKHLVLRRYLNAWFPILGMTQGRILFIDGFAGPGLYSHGELGSPLIALDSFIAHRGRGKITAEVFFLFIEADGERARVLETQVKTREPFPERCEVQVECGEFAPTLNSILGDLDSSGARLAPSFVMIDPFGVSGVPFSAVRRILANPACEIYFSFMIEAINRFHAQKEFDRHLTDLFGCVAWRQGIDLPDSPERRRFFYDLYERQLRAAGAGQVVRFELFEGGRLVYAIFFASRSTKGSARMKEAIWKAAGDGSFQFRGFRQSDQISLSLEQEVNVSPLASVLRERFAGRDQVSVEEVTDFVNSDATDYYESHVRRVLKALEDRGQLQVEVQGQRRGRSFPKGRTRLRFNRG